MTGTRDVRPKRGMGGKMAGGNPDAARGRDPDDFYATPPNVTRALYAYYEEALAGATVWEPCAGDGLMAETLIDCGVSRVVCSDLNPRTLRAHSPINRIVRGDVLATRSLPAVDAVITNPPFNIAEEIIHHILTLPGGPPPFLALVLKSTFWHAARRAELFEKFTPSAIHPLRWRPDFKNLGAPTMEIMWCVWTFEPGERPGSSDLAPAYLPLDRPVEQ